jgi:hypothetical protein
MENSISPVRRRAKGRRPGGCGMDSINMRTLRVVPARPQDVLSLYEGHGGRCTGRSRGVHADECRHHLAAPIFCAGYTVYSGLRWADPKSHERVAVFGISGLGHLAVQYPKAAGFETIAVSHSPDKDKMIRDLGADEIVRDGKSLAAVSWQVDRKRPNHASAGSLLGICGSVPKNAPCGRNGDSVSLCRRRIREALRSLLRPLLITGFEIADNVRHQVGTIFQRESEHRRRRVTGCSEFYEHRRV